MAQTDHYAGPISFETLQLFKRLDPLPANAVAELQKIERLDISDFNEADPTDAGVGRPSLRDMMASIGFLLLHWG